eukprot:GHVR01018937.1.p1 GENE.GHVR01018937.1~~GHVR01018937.1.p1  ORF type:complete len:721 (-),score=166.49 GHVR01018937.1:254-2371(-)
MSEQSSVRKWLLPLVVVAAIVGIGGAGGYYFLSESTASSTEGTSAGTDSTGKPSGTTPTPTPDPLPECTKMYSLNKYKPSTIDHTPISATSSECPQNSKEAASHELMLFASTLECKTDVFTLNNFGACALKKCLTSESKVELETFSNLVTLKGNEGVDSITEFRLNGLNIPFTIKEETVGDAGDTLVSVVSVATLPGIWGELLYPDKDGVTWTKELKSHLPQLTSAFDKLLSVYLKLVEVEEANLDETLKVFKAYLTKYNEISIEKDGEALEDLSGKIEMDYYKMSKEDAVTYKTRSNTKLERVVDLFKGDVNMFKLFFSVMHIYELYAESTFRSTLSTAWKDLNLEYTHVNEIMSLLGYTPLPEYCVSVLPTVYLSMYVEANKDKLEEAFKKVQDNFGKFLANAFTEPALNPLADMSKPNQSIDPLDDPLPTWTVDADKLNKINKPFENLNQISPTSHIQAYMQAKQAIVQSNNDPSNFLALYKSIESQGKVVTLSDMYSVYFEGVVSFNTNRHSVIIPPLLLGSCLSKTLPPTPSKDTLPDHIKDSVFNYGGPIYMGVAGAIAERSVGTKDYTDTYRTCVENKYKEYISIDKKYESFDSVRTTAENIKANVSLRILSKSLNHLLLSLKKDFHAADSQIENAERDFFKHHMKLLSVDITDAQIQQYIRTGKTPPEIEVMGLVENSDEFTKVFYCNEVKDRCITL